MINVSRMPNGEPEIFQSIQGEGINMGIPTAFLRLAVCNLSCSWCDTRYTWDWKAYDYDQEVMSISEKEVEERIFEFGLSHIVITGGEPMLQQRELGPMVDAFSKRGYHIEVETNGTISPNSQMINTVSQWNISPKTNSSGNRQTSRENGKTLRDFRDLKNAYFKFVIVDQHDVKEVSVFVDKYGIDHKKVILMPEGVTPEIVDRRGRWIAESCTELGFRFSTRLHILLWGDARGK